jgi:hypothetical protein
MSPEWKAVTDVGATTGVFFVLLAIGKWILSLRD